MLAVIKGDIIGSRQLIDQESWLGPLKNVLSKWGTTPKDWEVVWGDFFQLEIKNPEDVLIKAIEIKTCIKQTQPTKSHKNSSPVDVRMAIGIGEKDFSGTKISESNGSAFVHAGERFERLQKDNMTLGIKSPWKNFDKDFQLYLKLAGIFMDQWSVSSAELVEQVIHHPRYTQKELGAALNIKQSGVSSRW